jgi:hypothetical protein
MNLPQKIDDAPVPATTGDALRIADDRYLRTWLRNDAVPAVSFCCLLKRIPDLSAASLP